jgi:hypothetical protein
VGRAWAWSAGTEANRIRATVKREGEQNLLNGINLGTKIVFVECRAKGQGAGLTLL